VNYQGTICWGEHRYESNAVRRLSFRLSVSGSSEVILEVVLCQRLARRPQHETP
jgi:hypothetical protein